MKVTDGDTIRVQITGKRSQKVRLVEIDTPEGDQPYGREARQALVKWVSGREVRLETRGTDDFGRLLARVFVGEVDVNAELVRSGAAWVFRRYSDDPKLLALEREARENKRGLWALPEADRVPPWSWRHPDAVRPRSIDPKNDAFACGDKTNCREMASCAEARFHWVRCGLTRLDDDHDGVPCDALCRR